MIKTMFRDLF